MSARREFKRSVKVEIVKRATRVGQVYCEGCGVPARKWQIDHIIADGLQVDKSKPLTAAEGKLLCEPCHTEKTALSDVPTIAKAKRNEAKHLGVKSSKQKIPAPPSAKSQRVSRPPANGISEIARRFGLES